jgi:adenylosuccinate synthase
MTHLDVYDSLDEIKACVAYKIGDRIVEDFPSSIEALNVATPILRTFPGWKRELKNMRDYKSLPVEARDYIDFIEGYCETEIGVVSVGYERKDTFIRKNPWTK